MSPSPYELTIPPVRRAQCRVLLAAWDQRDPWNDVQVQSLTGQLLALISELTAPRILNVRGDEAAAKLLRGALGADQ